MARALDAARKAATPGVSLRALDEVAAEIIRAHGATSAFPGHLPAWAPAPCPGVLCASVNDALVHGAPDDHRLRAGDLLSMDCGAVPDGWTGDAAISFTVGRSAPTDARLLDTTRRAPAAGSPPRTAGRCAPARAAGPPTSSTRWRSPTRGPGCRPCLTLP